MVNVIKIVLTIFFISFTLLPFEQGRLIAYADIDCIPIGGQAWNQYLGWIVSQDTVADETVAPSAQQTFGICKEDSGIVKPQVKGAVWSTYGWICWGKDCKLNNPTRFGRDVVPNENVESYAYIDETIEKTLTRNFPPELNKPPVTIRYYPVLGWAKITNLKDLGWVSLSGDIEATGPIQDLENFNQTVNCATETEEKKEKNCRHFVYYDIDKNEFGGWAWNNRVGWIGFSGRTLYTTPYKYDVLQGDGSTSTVKGSACDPYCKDASFDPDIDSNKFLTQYLGRWVDVRGGSAYSQKGFAGKSASPPKAISYLKATGSYKETNAGGVEEKKEGGLGLWKSGCDGSILACADFGVHKKKNGVPTKTREGLYDVGFPKNISGGATVKEIKNRLGSLNVEELVLPAGSSGRINKYKQNIVRITDPLDLRNYLHAPGENPDIYYYEGDLLIGDPLMNLNDEWDINRGKLADHTSGARTIVVYGNLKINSRIMYNGDSVESLKKLPSVAWIVLKKPGVADSGNITINDCIQPRGIAGAGEVVPLAGLFFAEGVIKTGTGGKKIAKCKKYKDAPNATVLDGANEFFDAPLRIYGKMVAQKIEFQRGVRGFSKASEAIWDDGRLIVNPPPGVEEFVKKLPLW